MNTLFPRIGFGTGDYFWNSQISDLEKIKLIRVAIDNEITLIDTAPEYGLGVSENLVGKAIKGIRESVTIATKFSPGNNYYQQVISARAISKESQQLISARSISKEYQQGISARRIGK